MDMEGNALGHQIGAWQSAPPRRHGRFCLDLLARKQGGLVFEVKDWSQAERSGQIAAPSRPPTRQSRPCDLLGTMRGPVSPARASS